MLSSALTETLTETKTLGAWLYDDHLVVCDLEHRHLALFNPTAAVVWILLTENFSQDDIAREYARVFGVTAAQAESDVDGCLQQWQASGWLKRTLYSAQNAPIDVLRWRFGDATGDDCLGESFEPDGVRALRHVPIGDAEFGSSELIHEQACCFGDVPFQLKVYRRAGIDLPSSLSVFSQRVMAVAQGFACGEVTGNAGVRAEHWVLLQLDQDSISVIDSLGGVETTESLELAMSALYEACIRVSYPNRRIVLTLHAAGVMRGHTLSLAGVSGVGKSTLSAFLANSGWDLLGDDVLPIELSSGGDGLSTTEARLGLLPFPTAISIKDGAWSALRVCYPQLDSLPVVQYGGKSAKYVVHDRQPIANQRADWHAIVLPRFALGHAVGVRRLAPAVALQGLLTAGLSLFGNPTIADVDLAIKALGHLPAHEMVYGNFAEAQACLNDLTQS